MTKHNLLLATIIGSLSIGGCGGGSSVALTGKVIDGYIGGATVCLDVNNNYQCDADDPSTVSSDDGSYSIDYSESIEGLHVLAEVDEDATDQDLDVCTDNHVKHSYMLIAPAERSSVITPMTTLVSTEMLKTGKNIDDATKDVQDLYDLSFDPLDYDFKESGDDDAAEVARKYVAAIAVVNNSFNSNQSVMNTDLSDGEVMMGAILKARDDLMPSLIWADPIEDGCADPEDFIMGIAGEVDGFDLEQFSIDDAQAMEDEVRGLTNATTGKPVGM